MLEDKTPERGFTADVFSTKTWEVTGEVTYAVKGEFQATSKEAAEELFKKRVRENNVTHIKVTGCTIKPQMASWEGKRPPGSPLRHIDTPDMPTTPPPPAKSKSTLKREAAQKKKEGENAPPQS